MDPGFSSGFSGKMRGLPGRWGWVGGLAAAAGARGGGGPAVGAAAVGGGGPAAGAAAKGDGGSAVEAAAMGDGGSAVGDIGCEASFGSCAGWVLAAGAAVLRAALAAGVPDPALPEPAGLGGLAMEGAGSGGCGAASPGLPPA